MSYFESNTPDVVLKSLFKKYDSDNSGFISTSELPVFLRDDLGLSENEADIYALLVDKDANGKLNFNEFKAWLHNGGKLVNVNDSSRFYMMEKAVEMFQKYDLDKSGAVERDEFTLLLKDIGGKPDNVDIVLNALDKDGNSKISFYEFLKWLNWVDIGDF